MLFLHAYDFIRPTRFCVCRKQYCKIYLLLSEPVPTCTTNATKDHEVLEGQYIKFSCEQVYQGHFHPKQRFWWLHRHAFLKIKNESRNGLVKSSTVHQLGRRMDGVNFYCDTYFTVNETRENYSNSYPSNNNAFTPSYEFPKLTVYCKY